MGSGPTHLEFFSYKFPNFVFSILWQLEWTSKNQAFQETSFKNFTSRTKNFEHFSLNLDHWKLRKYSIYIHIHSYLLYIYWNFQVILSRVRYLQQQQLQRKSIEKEEGRIRENLNFYLFMKFMNIFLYRTTTLPPPTTITTTSIPT